MAQFAVPILLMGTAYLISNNREEDDEFQEGYSDIKDSDNMIIGSNDTSKMFGNESNQLSSNSINENYNSTDDMMSRPGGSAYLPILSKTDNNVNIEQNVSQYQDKYFIDKKNNNSNSDSRLFKNLAGKTVDTNDFGHNNMKLYYSGKSNGYNPNLNETTILDNYTGQGTYDIKKEELSSFFKPEDNIQSVYGNQNVNDFYQSRVGNVTDRQANTKPWTEIKDTPGIGMKYDENTNKGLNNYNEDRNLWLPKNVDELRTENNPKSSFCLHDHMGPATKSIQNRGISGKIVKQNPESFFVNSNNLGMIATTANSKSQPLNPDQILTDENRDTTSVEYFGTKGNNTTLYTRGKYLDPHKNQLNGTPVINPTNTNKLPNNKLNYGKDSFSINSNNRTTIPNNNYYGNVTNTISNLTKPIINGLRHSKKTNILTESHSNGYLSSYKKPTLFDPNKQISTTNREMYEDKQNMNYLNVQKQDDSAYMTTRPVLVSTQRSSTNQSQMGPASSDIKGNKNYSAEYNQDNVNKLYASDVKSGGNMSLFNSNINMRDHNIESCNNRQTPFYNPGAESLQNPIEKMGECTSLPQNYAVIDNNKDDLLKAFKTNPYTHSLNSAV